MKRFYAFLVLLCSISLEAQPPGWMYNKPMTVTNPNGVAAVNYQLKLTINTQSLISAGQMLANGNDIRFGATCTGTVFFNYWIEGGLNTPTTAIWVKIPMIAANTSSTIFMFHGNPGAGPMSSIPGTFRGPNSATDSVSAGTSGGFTQCQRGFRFAPNQDILVTDFGKNEPSGTTRYVTLFDWTSTAIITQTQVSGPNATYSYGPIPSPIWLTSGTQYVLQIYGLVTDGYFYQVSSQIGQHLTYFDMRYSNGGTQNTFPNSVLANYHYGYGDFLYYICSTLAIVPTYTMGGNLINITATSASLCVGSSATLSTNASGSFTWSNGSGSSSIIVSPLVTTTYSVAETNSVGCNSNAFLTVTVSSGPPSLTVTASAATICPTNTVILTASGALSYTWTGGITNGVVFSPANTTTYVVTGGNGCGTSTAQSVITVSALPVVAISTPTIVCSGNTATLSAGGANNYTWNPGNLTGSSVFVSPQVSTIYTVVGTASVCSGIFTLSLPANPNPTVSASVSNFTICLGESSTLTATGALGYTWTPGGMTGSQVVVTPTTPTGYVVTGTNNFGCSASVNQAVIVYSGPVMGITASNTLICPGGSVTLGSSGASSYTWSTGANSATITANPASTTVYSVMGTSPNVACATTKTIEVSVFVPSLTVNNPVAICVGNSATLTANGADFYYWSNGGQGPGIVVNPASSAGYTVTGVNNIGVISCSTTATTSVTVNALPTVTATSTRTNICKNESTTLVASGAVTYSWSTSATTTSITVNPLTQTIYSLVGTDANGCKNSATILIRVFTCTGIEESLGLEKTVLVFPNPNKGEFTLKGGYEIELVLVNALGQTLQTIHLNAENEYKAKISGLSKGVYFVQGASRAGDINVKILVNE